MTLISSIFQVYYHTNDAMILCRHEAHLLVQGATGGLWRFPLRFQATEPEPDDLVVVEAAGLNRESAVAFRLTSNTK